MYKKNIEVWQRSDIDNGGLITLVSCDIFDTNTYALFMCKVNILLGWE